MHNCNMLEPVLPCKTSFTVQKYKKELVYGILRAGSIIFDPSDSFIIYRSIVHNLQKYSTYFLTAEIQTNRLTAKYYIFQLTKTIEIPTILPGTIWRVYPFC